MERIRIYIVLMLAQLFCLNVNGRQQWTLNNPEGNKIYPALTDSITFEKVNGKFVQQLWRDGIIVSSIDADYGMRYIPEENDYDFELYTVEEEGIDAILATDGSYAMLYYPNYFSHYVLVSGVLGSDDKDYLVMNDDGYLKSMTIGKEEIITFMYLPDKLYVIDSQQNILAQIPYSYFEKTRHFRGSSPAVLAQRTLYNALSIQQQIKDYLKLPVKSFCLDLQNYLYKGYYTIGNSKNELIDSVINREEAVEIIKCADRQIKDQICGDVYLQTESPYIDGQDITIVCDVMDSPTEGSLWLQLKKDYSDNVSLDMTLSLTVYYDEDLTSTMGKYNHDSWFSIFDFTVDKTDYTYYFEPSLTISFELVINPQDASKAIVGRLSKDRAEYEGALITKLTTKTYWYIYGDKDSFYVPGYSCTIYDIVNITDESADVLCSFSDTPIGARNYIRVKNTDTGEFADFHAAQWTERQTIHVTGLEPNTEYSVYGVTIYRDVTYEHEAKTFKTVSFAEPDIASSIVGTWKCSETHYNYDGTTYIESYNLTLNEDGTVFHSGYANLPYSSWSISNGKMSISIMTMATQTFNSGIDYSGDILDAKHEIVGTNQFWYFNDVVGYVGGDGYHFVMTR